MRKLRLQKDAAKRKVVWWLIALCPAFAFAWAATEAVVFSQDSNKTDDGKPAFDRSLSLRGKLEDFAGVTLVGLSADQYVRFEPEGVRIALPAGYPGERKPTGIEVNMPVAGDFEITVNFEILHAPEAADDFSGATRLNLLAYPKDGGFATVGWRVLVKKGRQIMANASGGGFKGTPANTEKGRFRLIRKGPDIYFLHAPGASADFVLLHQQPFKPSALKAIGLIGVTSDPKVALDVRFTDLRIRSGAETPPPSVARATRSAPKGLAVWLLAGFG